MESDTTQLFETSKKSSTRIYAFLKFKEAIDQMNTEIRRYKITLKYDNQKR